MLEHILPDEVAVEESYEDALDCVLFAEEEASVGQAVEGRRKEFTTVRACARRAFARLGMPAQPVPNGPHGEPCWPPGLVGSMTHCAGYRACALASARQIIALGIDAEPNHALPGGVLQAIALDEECALLQANARTSVAVNWDRLLFSAKETVYKTWYPLTGRRLDFLDATVTFMPDAHTFSARLRSKRASTAESGVPAPVLRGGWHVQDGLIVTAIALTEGSLRCTPVINLAPQ